MEEKIYNRILKEIEEKGDLFFPDIENIFIEEKFEYKGEKALFHPEDQKLIIWCGWNEKAINIAMKLIKHFNIVAIQCNTVEIALHPLYLDFPIAKSDKRKHTQFHWFPTKLSWQRN